jgi:hypothetical protein
VQVHIGQEMNLHLLLFLREKTLPVQIMNLGEAVIHDLNGPIFGLHLKVFRLCNDLNNLGTAHKPFAPFFSSIGVLVLGHDGYAGVFCADYRLAVKFTIAS